MKAEEYIKKYLGQKVKDKVSGFKGVVSSVSFDLYGCVQTIVTPAAKPDGTIPDCRWFDVNRLQVTSKKPVMELPAFVTKDRGPAYKPPR